MNAVDIDNFCYLVLCMNSMQVYNSLSQETTVRLVAVESTLSTSRVVDTTNLQSYLNRR